MWGLKVQYVGYSVAEVSSVEDAEKSAGSVVEVLDEVDLGGVIDGYTPGKEVIWDVDKSSSTGCEQEDMIELPPLGEGADRECLVAETKSDKSLTLWRKLGKGKKGFTWKDNLLYVTQCDSVFQAVQVLVLPAGHLGFRKVVKMVKRRFLWPRLAADVENHCKSCITCQRCCDERLWSNVQL